MYSRVFHASNFADIGFTPEQMEKAAIAADKRVKKTGRVLYGNLYADGTCRNFTSEKNIETDTHVLLSLDINRMAKFAPVNSPIKTEEEKTHEQTIQAMAQQISVLESSGYLIGEQKGALEKEIQDLKAQLKSQAKEIGKLRHAQEESNE